MTFTGSDIRGLFFNAASDCILFLFVIILLMSHRQPLLHEAFAALGIHADAHWIAGRRGVVSGRSDSSGETTGWLNSEDTRTEAAQNENLRMKYFHLQASDLQKRPMKFSPQTVLHLAKTAAPSAAADVRPPE